MKNSSKSIHLIIKSKSPLLMIISNKNALNSHGITYPGNDVEAKEGVLDTCNITSESCSTFTTWINFTCIHNYFYALLSFFFQLFFHFNYFSMLNHWISHTNWKFFAWYFTYLPRPCSYLIFCTLLFLKIHIHIVKLVRVYTTGWTLS